MIVAITGATGFIGEMLVKENLALGNEVRVLSRRKPSDLPLWNDVEVIPGGLLSSNTHLKRFVQNADILYHCAAEIRNEALMEEVNHLGTSNLIKACSGKIGHWVQLSSVGVYGPISNGEVDEDYPYNPINMYEKTKASADKAVIDLAVGNYTYTILRPSIVFGAKMRNSSLYSLMKAIEKRTFFYIGKTGASANYIPVEEVVRALIFCGTNQHSRSKIYNISDWTTIEQFVGTIAHELGVSAPMLRIPLPVASCLGLIGDTFSKFPLKSSRVKALTSRAIYKSERIKKDLGYTCQISLKEGLINLIDEYKNR